MDNGNPSPINLSADQTQELVKLTNAVLESAKYGQIDSGLIAHIGAQELLKGRKLKEAVKATKNKLHQVSAAYLAGKMPYQEWLEELVALSWQSTEFKEACRRIMQQHASTRERLPILDDFYREIFGHLPPITSVLDLACGLNPLAASWMQLDDSTVYYACDIYYDMMFFIGKFLELLPFPSHVGVCDILNRPPDTKVDLVLLQKTIPCLEQIEKNAGEKILNSVQADHYLITFPAHSLGGRDKGMRENYEARFNSLAEGRNWQVKRFEFETELAFLVSDG